jgi:hypothetical protein
MWGFCVRKATCTTMGKVLEQELKLNSPINDLNLRMCMLSCDVNEKKL